MRTILIVGTVLLIVFVAVFRQQIFIRDPLGKVERNGVAQDAARLYIDYSNDVLVEDAAANRRYLVEGWNGVPGMPKHLACLTALVCWTDATEAQVFPLGKVERNGIAQAGARLYINYSNDVLVEDAAADRRYLVEGWNGVPGVPKHLACLTALACWTDGDEAEVFPLGNGPNQAHAVMSAKEVTFADETGAMVRVQLR